MEFSKSFSERKKSALDDLLTSYHTLFEEVPPRYVDDRGLQHSPDHSPTVGSPASSQAGSPFFSLPYELREQVYQHAGFLNAKIHIFLERYADALSPAAFNSLKFGGVAWTKTRISTKRWHYLVRACHRAPHVPLLQDDCRDTPSTKGFGLVGFILSCRQAYHEVIPHLYASSTFSLASVPMARFAHLYFPPALLARVQKLEILIDLDCRLQHGSPPNIFEAVYRIPERFNIDRNVPQDRGDYRIWRTISAYNSICVTTATAGYTSLSSLSVCNQMTASLMQLWQDERIQREPEIHGEGPEADLLRYLEASTTWTFWQAHVRRMFLEFGTDTALGHPDARRELVVESEVWKLLELGERGAQHIYDEPRRRPRFEANANGLRPGGEFWVVDGGVVEQEQASLT
ncbi:hypothetical protein KVT40_002714 [Elsinoe batatas]|uniref:DUF7730 domain-containing protein n=1 Tax=Elsinoe batatas TaxID=2601811 RepID=A0A8K0L365_9PEZI|nr:hypothetical protein KVT40_002714 [Elsinoe batatas]